MSESNVTFPKRDNSLAVVQDDLDLLGKTSKKFQHRHSVQITTDKAPIIPEGSPYRSNDSGNRGANNYITSPKMKSFENQPDSEPYVDPAS